MFYELKGILRKMRVEKNFSILIISGLVLAFTVAVPLVCSINYHQSFDRFHTNHERIFNVYIDEIYQGTKDVYGELPLAFGEYIQELFPEVESMTRTKDGTDVLVSKDNDNTWKEDVLWVDSSFKDIFRVDLLTGDKAHFLNNPSDAFISESLSNKIFGDVNSTGENIVIDGKEYSISGIFKDNPTNTHQKFSVLLSLKSRVDNSEKYKWDSYEFLTYIKLKNNTTLDHFEKKIQSLISDYWIPWVKKTYDLDYVFNKENSLKLHLLAVSDIHLQGSFISSFEKQANISVVNISQVIIMVLLVIAYFNLMGFSLSKGKKYQIQFDIKRYIGITRVRILRTFIYEHLIYTIIAFIVALFITSLLWKSNFPLLTDFVSIPLTKYLFPIGVLFLGVLVIAVISGLLIGIFFSKPVQKSKFSNPKTFAGSYLNRAIIISQIAASIILIIGIAAIFKQLKYVSKYDTGINTKNIVVISNGNKIRNQYNAFKNELKKSPFVKEVACSNSYPFNWMSTNSYILADTPSPEPYPFQYFRADIGFQGVFNIKMNDGRWFSEKNTSDNNTIILNQSAVDILGLNNPLEKTFYKTDSPSDRYQVLGIATDFNFQSLHHKVAPLLLCPMKEGDWWRFIEIKGATGNRQELIATISEAWNQISGNSYLDYTFLEDKIAFLYEREQKMKQSLGIFSLIAILITCFGLLGTVLNTTMEKTKEIGIRKVNGAKISEILTMLNKDFIKWVAIAFVVACPIAYYAMNKWLENFAYKTTLSWWIFALAGVLALGIALLTVSWQCWRAAARNPVEALRYE